MSEKEKRIKAITRIYYSNPKIQEVLCKFAQDREVVPRYFEGFGKRPDTIQYPSDIIGLVSRGATSFHSSEEIWNNPLEINSDMSPSEFSEIRKSWDLVIDIDSPFLDYSKIAAELIIKELEDQGIKNYGLKFSGSKGFHILVPAKAFPDFFQETETKKMFPEWPRAISEYLMFKIKPEYNKRVTSSKINFEALKERTNLTKEDVTQIDCPNCGSQAKRTNFVSFKCDRCNAPYAKPNYKVTRKKLKCTDEICPGFFEVISEEDSFFCEKCKTKLSVKGDNTLWRDSRYKNTSTVNTAESKSSFSKDFKEQVSGEKIASLDLVLVASRHLFRMPYSLHEKTSLSSIVLTKDQIKNFSPKDANPLNIQIKNFVPESIKGEATRLLSEAIFWKDSQVEKEERALNQKYKKYAKIKVSGVTEDMFPKAIKKLLKGLLEGRKRGLFVLLTFLRTLSFSPDYINSKVREWNKLNNPPLKEGYIRSQIDWHLKQNKQILPPNYKNDNFYKDLKLIDQYPKEKNPIVEVLKKVRKF